MQRLLTFAIVGVVAQLVDGALGMGYGVTATTMLLSSGATPVLASASVHLAEVGTTLASGVSHWRFGNVSWRTVRWLALPGAAGGFAGATALASLPGDRVRPVVAVILVGLGLTIIVRAGFGTLARPVAENHLKGRYLGPLGVGAGFLDAVGGGGWGPVTTPTLMTAGRLEPRRAVGSASASEFVVALGASAGFLLSLGTQVMDLALVGALLAGGVLAAPLAAWLVRRLPAPIMGTLVGGIVIITNVRILALAAGLDGPTRMVMLTVMAGAYAALVLRVRARSRPVGPLAGPAGELEAVPHR